MCWKHSGSVRRIKNCAGSVPVTSDELLKRKVPEDEALLLDPSDDMGDGDDVPLEYASKRQRTVWLTD